jgi:hypothetical protein
VCNVSTYHANMDSVPAVILLVQDVRFTWVQEYTMGVVPILGKRIGEKVRPAPGVERCPVVPLVDAFEHPAAGHAQVQVVRVARVDQDRV